MQLKVSYEDRPDRITVVRVESDGQGGALDVSSARELRTALLRLVEERQRVFAVDFSAIDDVDSAGGLVEDLKWVYLKGGVFSLVVTSEGWRAVLSKTGLYRVVHTRDTVSSAVEALTATFEEASEGWARQRRAADEGADESGGHTYEHLSDDVTLVKVMAGQPFGPVDKYTAPSLRNLFVDLVNQGRYFLVADLTDVGGIDSTALGVIVGGLKRVLAHDGSMVLVVPSGRIQKVFRITGLTKVLPMFDTVDPAVEFLGRKMPGAHP